LAVADVHPNDVKDAGQQDEGQDGEPDLGAIHFRPEDLYGFFEAAPGILRFLVEITIVHAIALLSSVVSCQLLVVSCQLSLFEPSISGYLGRSAVQTRLTTDQRDHKPSVTLQRLPGDPMPGSVDWPGRRLSSGS